MKIIAAVQSKSSSSRGLLHYIAHSKIDAVKEPSQREIFNEYADDLDVKKANSFLPQTLISAPFLTNSLIGIIAALTSHRISLA